MLRITILMLALISGGAAAWLSGIQDAGIQEGSSAATPSLKSVLVAGADIVPGTRIAPDTLRWQPWPLDAVSERYITRDSKPDATEAFVGMGVRSAILDGEPVHLGKLVPDDAGLLSVMLAKGSRAVAVRITADTTAGGFILPNDRVDVLHTKLRQGADGQTDATSTAILQRVRVLAIDQTIDAVTGSVVGKTATLELKPHEAQTLVAAEAAGAITLALRSISDADEPETGPVDERIAQAPDTKIVRIYRGVLPEQIEFER